MIGHRLRATANRLNLTESAAAKYFGVSPSTYRKWANDTRKPGAAVIRLIDVLEYVEVSAPKLHLYFMKELG